MPLKTSCQHFGRLSLYCLGLCLLVLQTVRCVKYPVKVHRVDDLRKLRTSIECTKERRAEHEVCVYENLIIYDGKFYYITEDPNTKPRAVHVGLRFDEPGSANWIQPTAVNPHALPFDWSTVRKFQVKGAVVNYIPSWANILHLIGEYMPSLHTVMCTHLKLCSYADRKHTMLVNTNPEVAVHAAWGPGVVDAFRCISSRPPLWVHHADVKQMVFILSRAVVGYGSTCRVDHMQCIGDDNSVGFGRGPAPPDMMDSWLARMNRCVGLNQTEPALPARPKVVVVDRDMSYGRAFLNSAELVHTVRKKWGQKADVKYVKLEDLPLRPQAHVFHDASVVIMMHGAAIANWIFLPRKAVIIHVLNQPWYYDLQRYAETAVASFSSQQWGLVNVANSDPHRIHFMMEKLTASEAYQKMPAEHKVSLLETKRCPGEDVVPLYVCAFQWLHTGNNLMLNPRQLEEALENATQILKTSFDGQHPLL